MNKTVTRYTVFDVETPNRENDRICGIGVTVVDDGCVVGHFESFVNPKTYFDQFNVQLTGIGPEQVRHAPTFPELWEEIGDWFVKGAVLVAHNASFDLSVLSKCLCGYRIAVPRHLPYVCTYRVGKKVYPSFPDHKLNTMCRLLHIPLSHHHAGSDSRACAELLLRYLHENALSEESLRYYDTVYGRTVKNVLK